MNLYRKFRSQLFDDLKGQTHIKQTLKNAIELQKIAHAYIFSGPRGTGKTSSARIFAKSLNCRKGPCLSPCQTCDHCLQITAGQSIDVLEIDAASHTGVDHIRDLNEKINFSPVSCLDKLYIIDEAHMLSTGAFNALLKTLEEPPLNTLFILATTEAHKIPITIHSRCHHLHFQLLANQEIQQQLLDIIKAENLTVSSDALSFIINQAKGSMRDAITLLDQSIAFSGSTISLPTLRSLLGAADPEHLHQLVDGLIKKQPSTVIQSLDTLFKLGLNPLQFLYDFTNDVKEALLINLKMASSKENSISSQLSCMTTLDIHHLLGILSQIEIDLKWFSSPDLLIQHRLLSFVFKDVKIPSAHSEQPQKAPSLPPQPPIEKPSSPLSSPTSPKTLSSYDSKKNWQEVLNIIKTERFPLFTIIKDAVLTPISEHCFELSLKQDFKFFKEKLKEESNQILIQTTCHKVWGYPIQIQYEQEPLSSEKPSPAEKTEHPFKNPNMSKSTTINHIVALFDGTIMS